MQRNDWGRTAANCWAAIPAHFGHAALDEWVVMPNHVHGIVVITDPVGARQCRAPTAEQFGHPVPGSIPTIIRSYKSAVAKRINLVRGTTTPPMWQRNDYEHVVRNERELNALRQYIRQNPAKWQIDRDNMANCHPEAISADDYLREANA